MLSFVVLTHGGSVGLGTSWEEKTNKQIKNKKKNKDDGLARKELQLGNWLVYTMLNFAGEKQMFYVLGS